jgi:hypothetical protein
MISETKRIKRFSGIQGSLLKVEEKVSDLRNVVIEEYVTAVRSPDGKSSAPSRSWIAISFDNIGQNSKIQKDMGSDTCFVTEYTLKAMGRLDDGSPKVAKVLGVYLESSTKGKGREVIFSNP